LKLEPSRHSVTEHILEFKLFRLEEYKDS